MCYSGEAMKIVFWLMLLCTAPLWAANGVVETSDGTKFEGEIRLEDGGVVISSTNETASRVELAKLALLRFQTPSAPRVAESTQVVHGLRGTYFSNRDL